MPSITSIQVTLGAASSRRAASVDKARVVQPVSWNFHFASISNSAKEPQQNYEGSHGSPLLLHVAKMPKRSNAF
jgi:hypothetical protein